MNEDNNSETLTRTEVDHSRVETGPRWNGQPNPDLPAANRAGLQGTLVAKIAVFMSRRPNESLSTDEIAKALNEDRRRIHTNMEQMITKSVWAHVKRRGKGVWVWLAVPGATPFVPPAPKHGGDAKPTGARAGGQASKRASKKETTMKKKDYSVRPKVLTFLREHPDQPYSISELGATLNVNPNQVASVLALLVSRHLDAGIRRVARAVYLFDSSRGTPEKVEQLVATPPTPTSEPRDRGGRRTPTAGRKLDRRAINVVYVLSDGRLFVGLNNGTAYIGTEV